MQWPAGYARVQIELASNADPDPMYLNVDFLGTPVNTAAVNAIAGHFQTHLLNQFSTSITATAIKAINGPSDESQVVEGTVTGAGGQSGATLPLNCALLIKKTSNTAGRKGRGRWFIPAPLRAEVDDSGTVDSVYAAAWNDAWEDFITAVITDEDTECVAPVIFHTSSSDTPSVITGITCASKIATQRRRLRP